MSEDALITVLQSDNLLLDEADILDKVTEWATVNSVSRLQGLKSQERKERERETGGGGKGKEGKGVKTRRGSEKKEGEWKEGEG